MSETLHKAAAAYLEHLRADGKSERTLYTYGKDFEQLEAFFGADRQLAKILPPRARRTKTPCPDRSLPRHAWRSDNRTRAPATPVVHVPRPSETPAAG